MGFLVMSFFSIIMPVYNVASYIRESVKSVLFQSFTDLELLLVDDGSTDGSSRICDEFAKNDFRIKCIHKKNEGVSIARNIGIKNANGEYVMFLDSDDTFTQDLLQQVYNKILQEDRDIILFGYQRIKYENKGFLILKQSIPPVGCTKEILLRDYKDLTFLLWNKACRKSLFEKINLKAIEELCFSEDSYMSYSLLSCTENISFLHSVGYNYLCRDTSATQKMSRKHRESYLKAVELISAFHTEGRTVPVVVKKIQQEARFAQINPDYDFSFREFFCNCSKFRTLFQSSIIYLKEKMETRLMKLYVNLILRHLDFFAYFLYIIRKWRRR